MKKKYEQPTLKLSFVNCVDVLTASPSKDSWTDADPEWGLIIGG